MSERIKPIVGAAVTAWVVFFVGVTYVFGPAMAADAPAGPLGPGWATLAITSILLVLFFDWANQFVGNPVRTGLIIAVSQILLVDVYYVLNGMRGVTAAAISALLLVVGWLAAATVYARLSAGGLGEAGGDT